jgi:hypothetical protein
MFTRDDHQETFTRRIGLNTQSDFDLVSEKDDSLKREKVCFPFVTLGDVICVMKLTRWLTDRGVRVGSHGFKAHEKLNDLLKECETENDNIIVVGSKRVLDGILDEYQRRSALPYRLDIRAVVHVPSGEDVPEDRDEFRSIVPVIVSRMPGQIGGVVTMIAANHGRAVSYVAKVLRKDELLENIFGDPHFDGWGRNNLPKKFQILLNVPVEHEEMLAGPAQVVDVWPKPSNHTGSPAA